MERREAKRLAFKTVQRDNRVLKTACKSQVSGDDDGDDNDYDDGAGGDSSGWDEDNNYDDFTVYD
jgi:hypothetical protein